MINDDLQPESSVRCGQDLLSDAFEAHFDELYRYCCLRVGRSAAEDLVSETFVRAVSRAPSFDSSRSTIRAWLFGIENNVIREWFRSRDRQRLLLIRTQPIDEGDHGAASSDLRLVLNGLPARDADVLLLVDAFGLTYAEAADSLGVPIGTIRSRLAMARRRLRKRLGHE